MDYLMKNEELLEIIACTKCKGPVIKNEEGLYCERCDLIYPIVDGIPIMLLDEKIDG